MSQTPRPSTRRLLNPGDELLTPAEVSQLLRVDPKTVTRWARKGLLSTIRTPGGHRRYNAAEVRRYMTWGQS